MCNRNCTGGRFCEILGGWFEDRKDDDGTSLVSRTYVDAENETSIGISSEFKICVEQNQEFGGLIFGPYFHETSWCGKEDPLISQGEEPFEAFKKQFNLTRH